MNRKKEDFARKILGYLSKNPEAGDNLEGIVRFWLESEKIEQSVDEVAEVLESLREKGALRRLKSRVVVQSIRFGKILNL